MWIEDELHAILDLQEEALALIAVGRIAEAEKHRETILAKLHKLAAYAGC